jgi:hypothetical protein
LLVGVVEPPAKCHLPNTPLRYAVRQSPPDFCCCCCRYCCYYYYNYCCFRVSWPPWRDCNCAQRKLPGKKNRRKTAQCSKAMESLEVLSTGHMPLHSPAVIVEGGRRRAPDLPAFFFFFPILLNK